MALTNTPVCDFGLSAPLFSLPGTDGKIWSLDETKKSNGLLVMFICNHCPYVKAIRPRLVETCRELLELEIGVVAINANDTQKYPDDNFENMKKIAEEFHFPFPYLLDETQEVAKSYGAVCTPDFFGYNHELKLQYRGRLDAGILDKPKADAANELLDAMKMIAATGKGPEEQTPSMGCSIKWK